ncbi:MAG: alpha/beta fold hydrolase [Deltaproteobacteria bacterium]|nr:alpha/beta fold hydrolase [Deltaproteobacteria bacterium]
MNEEQIIFPAGLLQLEGCYASSAGRERGAVVAHPHPLMGGSLENNVVETLVEAFFQQGYATLRFNFRGVGRSGGRYDEGVGEQDDLLAAADALRQRGVREILLAGYSFGAWIVANLLRRTPLLSDGVLVSPPIDLMDFNFSGLDGKIRLILAGERDPYCDNTRLMERSARIQAPVRLIPGADHFYVGRERELSAALAEYL